MKKVFLIALTLLLISGCNSLSEKNVDLDSGSSNGGEESQSLVISATDDFSFTFQYPESVELLSGPELSSTLTGIQEIKFSMNDGSNLVVYSNILEIGAGGLESFEVNTIELEGFESSARGFINQSGEELRIYNYDSEMTDDFFKGTIQFSLVGNDPELDDLEFMLNTLKYVE